MDDVVRAKRAKRAGARGAVLGMTPDARRRGDAAIANHLAATVLYQLADTILLYVNIEGEVSTDAIIGHASRLGKRIVVPGFLEAGSTFVPCELRSLQETVRGRFGVREPAVKRPCEPGAIDLAVIPGQAFALTGARLGRGGGHFDRFLRLLSPQTPIVGLAYECQICDNLPVESHDVLVGAVVTERGILWVDRDLATRARARERGGRA
ncbi:MAG: 5-formyltetrahydrofolate cyclo-ligase [Firmicutes bacterium]|nr:5-formyltetrahydrofolate cyclo-ligase [Bacillota bacterium]